MKILIFGLCVLGLAAAQSPAFSEELPNPYAALGGMAGQDRGNQHGAAVFEIGANDTQEIFYGNGHLRAELGKGSGIAARGKGGLSIIGLERGESGVSLQLGLEPANVEFSANTGRGREDFIEWTPSVAGGVQLGSDTCRLLALGRVGGALGTLGTKGVGYAYGPAMYLSCGILNASGELTRIERNGQSVDTGLADVSVPLKIRGNHSINIGLRGEVIDTHGAEKDVGFGSLFQSGDAIEKRGFVTLQFIPR